jgi:Mg-chelatase subunit ChlI
MRTTTPNMEALLDRFDSVTRETMIQLSRWKVEREEWRGEREELQRRIRRASLQDVQLMVIPLQATLQRVVGHIDRILAQGVVEGAPHGESVQAKP